MSDYLEIEEALDLANITDSTDNDTMVHAITAASRAIDSACGRRFYADDEVSERLFVPSSTGVCWVDDFYTTDDLVITVGGTEWTLDSDFILEPRSGVVNGIEGWPYTRLIAISPWFATCVADPYSVSVTAKWGWSAVPEPVRQACGQLTLWVYRNIAAPLGVAGFDQFGQIRVREHPLVDMMLQPYKRLPLPVA